MIAEKFVDLYARNSGLRDKLVAERDVVLTYALRSMIDVGVLDHLAFKGGTCLRKAIFGSAGRFSEDLDLQVSLRERPTLPARRMQLKPQAYFRYLEFSPFKVRSLEPIEMIAEKIRAVFQRAKVRDLYDLHSFAKMAFNGEHYDWGDLRSLIRASERVEPAEILSSIEDRYAVLSDLTELEKRVAEDAKSGWNEPLAERLRADIRELAARG